MNPNHAPDAVMRVLLFRPGSWPSIALVFAVLALAIAIVGYLVFDYQRSSITQSAEQRLATIAELRAQQIAAWAGEQRANAGAHGRGSLLAHEIAQWLERGAIEGETASAIRSQLASIKESYGYRIVTLVDPGGRPLLSTHEPPEITEVESVAVAQALRTGNTVISDFHISVDKTAGEAEIDVITPVYARASGTPPIAALIFDIDPERSLHPLIEVWPTPSPSAETLLVERSGSRVRYLTDLRHRKDAQFKLQLPMDQPNLVAAMGLKGQQGIVTGVDYRGVKVLAFLQPIPDSPWLMVAKVDLEEIHAPVQRLAGLTAATTAVLILIAALTTLALARAQRKELRRVNAQLEERVQSRTAELERSHQLLQALTAVQESIQEEERKRIARELHDELAQKLTVLKLQVTSAASTLCAAEPALKQQLQEMNALLAETMQAVGQIAANLRPVVLDELGLVTALRDLVDKFAERTRIECEFSVHPADLTVDKRLAMPLYRMVQEALTNVARHAEATEVIVSLYRDPSGKITLDITDNGKGVPDEDQRTRGSFGLIGMRERTAMLGGELKMQSAPGAGTSIEIVIP